MKSFVLLSLLVLSVSCASVSEEGKQVRILKEAPANCSELGDISSGNIASKASHTAVKNNLRNEVAGLGGNVLVLDSISAVSFGGYSGSGRALSCESL